MRDDFVDAALFHPRFTDIRSKYVEKPCRKLPSTRRNHLVIRDDLRVITSLFLSRLPKVYNPRAAWLVRSRLDLL